MSDALPVDKVTERAMLVAKAHGDLERYSHAFAQWFDSGPVNETDLWSWHERLAGYCLAYGRALNTRAA